MEHILKACARTPIGERDLTVVQHLRPQVDGPSVVHAVDVAEGRGKQVATPLAGAEHFGDAQQIIRGRVKLAAAGRSCDTVLGATDDPTLDLEHDVERRELVEQLRGELQVLIERQARAIEHVRVKQRRATVPAAPAGLGDQWTHERIERVRWSVVGVQCDQDRVAVGKDPRKLGERSRTDSHIVHAATREICGAAGRDLDDPVGARLGEPAHGAVERLRGRHVDGRKRVTIERTRCRAWLRTAPWWHTIAMPPIRRPRVPEA